MFICCTLDSMGSYGIGGVVGNVPGGGTQEARDKPDQIMQSNTDAEAWNLEVERVAPQLKVVNKPEGVEGML